MGIRNVTVEQMSNRQEQAHVNKKKINIKLINMLLRKLEIVWCVSLNRSSWWQFVNNSSARNSSSLLSYPVRIYFSRSGCQREQKTEENRKSSNVTLTLTLNWFSHIRFTHLFDDKKAKNATGQNLFSSRMHVHVKWSALCTKARRSTMRSELHSSNDVNTLKYSTPVRSMRSKWNNNQAIKNLNARQLDVMKWQIRH